MWRYQHGRNGWLHHIESPPCHASCGRALIEFDHAVAAAASPAADDGGGGSGGSGGGGGGGGEASARVGVVVV